MIQLKNDQQLQAGDILICKGKSLIAKGISLFTKSKFTHAAIVIDIWGELYIIDSQKDGTNPRKYKEWKKKYNYEFCIFRNISPDFDYEKVSKRAMSKSGHTPYDFFALFISQPIYQIFGVWLGKQKRKGADRMYCSEFVAWCFKIHKWWEKSPAALYEYLLKDIRFKKVLINEPSKDLL